MDTAHPIPAPALPAPEGILRSTSVFLAGLTLLGACLGVGHGPEGMLHTALTIPGLFLSVAALTAPALYIGAGLLGVAPPTGAAARALAHALLCAGRLVLGLAPAALFLMATMTSGGGQFGVTFVLVALTALVALRALYVGLGRERREATPLLFNWLYAGWSFLALGIGVFWFIDALGR